jgi:hypothetical protein
LRVFFCARNADFRQREVGGIGTSRDRNQSVRYKKWRRIRMRRHNRFPAVSALVHGEDQIVVIVIGSRAARRRASLVSEVRPHSLQRAGWQRVRRGQRLRSSRRWHDRSNEHPHRTVRIGCVVQIERVRRSSTPSPYRRGDFHGLPVRHRSASRGCDHDAIIGFIGVECSRGTVCARAIDVVGLIRLRASRHRVASQQQRRS